MSFLSLFTRMVVVGLLGSALSSAAAEDTSNPPLRIEFTLAIVDGQIPSNVFFTDEKGSPVSVTLNSATRSQVYKYSGSPRMLLWSNGAGNVRVPVAVVNFSAEFKRALVLLVSNPEAGLGQPSHLALAVEDGLQTAPRGSLRILNMSGGSLALELAGQQSRLASGPSPVYNVGRDTSAPPVLMRLARIQGEDLRMIFQGNINATPQERITMIVLSGATPDAVPRFRILRESIREEKPASKPSK